MGNKPYKGSFSVETWRKADMNIDVPKSAVTIQNNVVHVKNGSVQQVMGGIQFYAENSPFSWGYMYIKKITDSEGNILWENWDKKE